MKHQGNTDRSGNFRDISREREGYFGVESKDLPFPALVTAWYPKSQTMDVIRPTEIGSIEYEGVVVYGNFFEETGTIQTPKLATVLKEDGYTTIRDENQKDKDSEEYVLNTHIEAIVYKTSVGYAANAFRFLGPESSMLNNIKEGRKITRHDDGSLYIHDEDGNMQFVHPSGLNIKIGNSIDDIELEEDFPPHEKNVTDYDGEIIIDITAPSAAGDVDISLDGNGSIKLDHPGGSVFEVDATGKFDMSNSTISLKKINDDMNDIVAAIIVAEGVGPDTAKLTTLKTQTSTLLK